MSKAHAVIFYPKRRFKRIFNGCVSPRFALGHLPRRVLSCYLFLAAVAVLSACSSPDTKIYESFKCARAAAILGHLAEAHAAGEKAAPYLRAIGASQSRYMQGVREMSKQVEDERVPRGDGSAGQLEVLRRLYESSLCQALYR